MESFLRFNMNFIHSIYLPPPPCKLLYAFSMLRTLSLPELALSLIYGHECNSELSWLRIGDIPIEVVQVYTDGSRDDYYRSGSNPEEKFNGFSVFRSELIAIDEALGSLASLPNGKEIWILSDSRSAIQHLSNGQSVRKDVYKRQVY
ncbi:UNVERIFIED_CONTAM: hypothetical protein NCL1_14012 [Trichonephila clavipes]